MRTQPPRPDRRVLRADQVALTAVAVTAAMLAWYGPSSAVFAGAVALALLTLRPVRAMLRWCLAYAGMAMIRAFVVRRSRPYATLLDPPGGVADPDAPWLQWLMTRCDRCGA